MVVNHNTRLLDPTCGSGSALRAAKRVNAQAEVLGIESNEVFADAARRELALLERQLENQIVAGPMPHGTRNTSLEELGL